MIYLVAWYVFTSTIFYAWCLYRDGVMMRRHNQIDVLQQNNMVLQRDIEDWRDAYAQLLKDGRMGRPIVEIKRTKDGFFDVIKDGEVLKTFQTSYEAQMFVQMLTGSAVMKITWEEQT